MAAIVGTYGLVKHQTLAYTITMASASDTQTLADLLTTSGLAALSYPAPVMPSSLKAFLSATYTSAALMATAFRSLGGRIDFRQTGGTAAPAAPIVEWVNANPVINLSWIIAGGASNEVFEVVISLPHSLIQ